MVEAIAFKALELVVDPIICKLVAKSASYFRGDVADKLRELKTITLPKIQTVIEAAETTHRSTLLEPWLRDLKAAALEAEDVLDEYEYKLLEKKAKKKESQTDPDEVSGLSASLMPIVEYSHKFASKAKGALSSVLPKTQLMKRIDTLQKTAARVHEFADLLKLGSRNDPDLARVSNTTSVISTVQHRPTTISSQPRAVFGRDKERDYLVNQLISEGAQDPESSSSDWSVPVLAICGIGGAGKTTLAQYTYNDPRIERHFDIKMWVHVPRKFDAFVLDDVWWDEPVDMLQYWDQLLNTLNEVAQRGSRVLMTTRMEGVASLLGARNPIPLTELESSDCLSIIEYYAFDGLTFANYPELVEVGKQIVNRLKGSPLAARMMASNQLKRSLSADAWRRVLEGGMLSKNTMDVLSLSFKHLPAHLQRCFALCSLFPKGKLLQRDYLIRLWIAEGFVQASDHNDLMIDDIGGQYCDDLLYYSFFQLHPSSPNSYSIHDLLHDLAEDISKGTCFRIEDDDPIIIPSTVLHLSVIAGNLAVHIPNICKLVSLRTLIIGGGFLMSDFVDVGGGFPMFDFVRVSRRDLAALFEKLTSLRVLNLSLHSMYELPASICHSKHLRYLNLQGSAVLELPAPLCRLYHLQILNLERCRWVHSLPEDLNNLIGLSHLIVDPKLTCDIPAIGKLTALQTLREYHVRNDRRYGIEQLKNMSELRRSLHIKNLENVTGEAGAAKAMLKNKKHLDELALQWSDSSEIGHSQVLEALEPPPNLKKLKIHGYRGDSPSWMRGNQRFSALCYIQLVNCPNMKEVSCLPHNLRKLKIRRCPKLMRISPFQTSLEVVEMEECPGIARLLSKISSPHIADGNERQQMGMEGSRLSSLPLKHLRIKNCPRTSESDMEEEMIFRCSQMLTSLSELSIKQLPSLTSLIIPFGRHLIALRALEIYDCKKLTSLAGLGTLPSLQTLRIRSCPRLMMTMPAEHLPSSLQKLHFFSCDGIDRLPSGYLQGLTLLSNLYVGNCARLQSLGDLSNLATLQELSIEDCPELTSLGEGLEAVTFLETMRVVGCPRLISQDNGRLPSVGKWLCIDNPLLLAVLLQEQALASLRELKIVGCAQDTAFTPSQEEIFMHLTSLASLRLYNCENLPSLPSTLAWLSTLRMLYVINCPSILVSSTTDAAQNLRIPLQLIRRLPQGAIYKVRRGR